MALSSNFAQQVKADADIVRIIGETLTLYGKYTAYVHLADGEQRTEPGSLPFDYRAGFRALKKAGFSGWFTVESRASDNPEAAPRVGARGACPVGQGARRAPLRPPLNSV